MEVGLWVITDCDIAIKGQEDITIWTRRNVISEWDCYPCQDGYRRNTGYDTTGYDAG